MSFDLIFSTIVDSGLYDATDTIYVVVLNTELCTDERFNKDKIKLIYGGKCNIYERATLYKMIEISETCEPSHFWYAHTKGLRHFGKPTGPPVIDWIKMMCHFNFTLWKNAHLALDTVDVCGCNYRVKPSPHFSGNFWWATSNYIKSLPKVIHEPYLAPEMWLFKSQPTYSCLHNCNVGHRTLYPPSKYM
jgi:hypothetical protein